MDDPLCEIIYISRNTSIGSETVEARIGKILAHARRSNEHDGITGAMVFSDGCFAQVLEGPPDAVERLFARISIDPRHSNVLALSKGTTPQRTFPDWSMASIEQDVEREAFGPALARAFLTPDKGAALHLRLMLRRSIEKIQVWGSITPDRLTKVAT